MKHDKSYYTALNFDGFEWASYYRRIHKFTRSSNGASIWLQVIYCTDEQIESGKLPYLIKHGLTLSSEDVKRIRIGSKSND